MHVSSKSVWDHYIKEPMSINICFYQVHGHIDTTSPVMPIYSICTVHGYPFKILSHASHKAPVLKELFKFIFTTTFIKF